jgi:hypothetical protein
MIDMVKEKDRTGSSYTPTLGSVLSAPLLLWRKARHSIAWRKSQSLNPPNAALLPPSHKALRLALNARWARFRCEIVDRLGACRR